MLKSAARLEDGLRVESAGKLRVTTFGRCLVPSKPATDRDNSSVFALATPSSKLAGEHVADGLTPEHNR
jgi:hypothetical protein